MYFLTLIILSLTKLLHKPGIITADYIIIVKLNFSIQKYVIQNRTF